MLDFLLAGPNLPFTIALGAMVGLVLLEMVSLLLGGALSQILDSALNLDFDLDIDADVEAPELNPVASALAWMHLGKVPFLIWLMLALFSFGVAGLVAQQIATGVAGALLPGWMASVAALAATIPLLRVVGGFAAKTVLRDETTAVSQESFLGTTATVTLGTAARGRPTQAKLTDPHGQTHYVLVEPLKEEDEFSQGQAVTLIKREGAKFFVVGDSVDALMALDTPTPSAQELEGLKRNA